jgi:DNA-binding PadR family transcriptional regulator
MSRSKPSKSPIQYPLDILGPSQQLDEVLKCLMVKAPPMMTALEIVNKLQKQGALTKESDVIEILKKLEKDGFVQSEERNYREVFDDMGQTVSIARTKIVYSATFEGRTLIDYEAGYRGRLDSQQEEKTRTDKLEKNQRANEKSMRRLTFWIVVGTLVAAAYYLNELCCSYHWFEFCNCK